MTGLSHFGQWAQWPCAAIPSLARSDRVPRFSGSQSGMCLPTRSRQGLAAWCLSVWPGMEPACMTEEIHQWMIKQVLFG